MVLKIGELAPDFTIMGHDNNLIRLSEYRGERNVVLFFYPKDNSPGCTKEACGFRDHLSAFKNLDAEVIGISADSSAVHKAFANQHHLTFRLGTDDDDSIKNIFGVKGPLGLPGRVTYVIDKRGVVVEAYSSQIWYTEHAKKAKVALERLASAQTEGS